MPQSRILLPEHVLQRCIKTGLALILLSASLSLDQTCFASTHTFNMKFSYKELKDPLAFQTKNLYIRPPGDDVFCFHFVGGRNRLVQMEMIRCVD